MAANDTQTTATHIEDEQIARTHDAALLFGKIPIVPFAFLGLGLYRAWIEIVFVGSFVDFPAINASMRDVFDISMVAVVLLCAACARRIGPLFKRRSAFVLCIVTLTASTAMVFLSGLFPDIASTVAVPSAVLGGFGIALLILFWSEFYGCLNPLRVASYYAAAIVVGAVVVYVYRGFMFPWLFAMTALLPVVSLACIAAGYRQVPASEQPSSIWTKLSVPWKAILLMAIYAFAYGLLESDAYESSFGPHSSLGTLAAGIVVFFGVAFRGKRFDFGVIYRIALPLMVAALLLLPSLNFLGGEAGAFCVSAGYTLQSILVMLICANLCYRYGASAIWIFGIERGVRQVFMILGRDVSDMVPTLGMASGNEEALVSALAIVAIVAATMILMSERSLSSRWGADVVPDVVDGVRAEPTAAERKHELSSRVADEARAHKLSVREEEVLLLLAQRKTIGEIEHELFIANGTAKAHVRHIYQKLEIHTRQELFEMLGVDEGPKGE